MSLYVIIFTLYITRSPQEVSCISHNAPLPDDVKTEVEETPSEVSTMVIQHAFSPGVEVLARWSDGILYLGNVVKVWSDEGLIESTVYCFEFAQSYFCPLEIRD